MEQRKVIYMDMYHREALRQLGESIKASGDVVATVSQWPESERHAKEAHIMGAMANARRTRVVIEQMMIQLSGPADTV